MSGIFGIFNRDGRPVESATLRAMGATMKHRGTDGCAQWQEGPLGMGCQLARITPESVLEEQPARNAGGQVAVFDGRLDNRDELAKHLQLAATAPDTEYVLAAYGRWGKDFVTHLLGDFALGIWDARKAELLVARDQIGLRPLYYACTPDLFVFATEVKAILAHPQVRREPDLDMLADLLIRDRQDLWGVTWFRGIVSLPPGHLVRVTAATDRQEKYWDFDPSRQLRFAAPGEYAEAFREIFRRAVLRRLRSRHPVMVQLSGGVDSSAVFCTAETLRRSLPGLPPLLAMSHVSAVGSAADERQYLDDIERMYGAHVERVPFETIETVLADADRQMWHSEAPFYELLWPNVTAFFRRVRETGARTILTGHWGDQMVADQSYMVDLAGQGRWREARAHLREFPTWFTDANPKWFRRTFYRQLGRHLAPAPALNAYRAVRKKIWHPQRDRAWYTEDFRKRAHWSGWDFRKMPHAASRHAEYVYMLCRSRHVIHMEQNNKHAAMNGLDMLHPFLDRELISFIMSIPGEIVCRHGVPKAILREAMKGIMPESIVQRRWKGDTTFVENGSVARGHQELCEFMSAQDSAMVEFGLVEPSVLADELRALRVGSQRDSSLSWEISDLVAVELWLRVFFRGRIPEFSEGDGLNEISRSRR